MTLLLRAPYFKFQSLCLLLSLLLLTACAGRRQLRSELGTVKTGTEKVSNSVDSIRQKLAILQAGRTIDSVSAGLINDYLDSLESKADAYTKTSAALNSQRVHGNEVEFVTIRAARMAAELEKDYANLQLINELLATNTLTRLSHNVLFDEGEYMVSGNGAKSKAVFVPMFDNIRSFADRFSTPSLQLSVVVLGYADAQVIDPASSLHQRLRNAVSAPDATSAMYNAELSRLRALSVSQLLQRELSSRLHLNHTAKEISIRMLPQGRGEEFPEPGIANYSPDDERRRVVYVYWSLLPR